MEDFVNGLVEHLQKRPELLGIDENCKELRAVEKKYAKASVPETEEEEKKRAGLLREGVIPIAEPVPSDGDGAGDNQVPEGDKDEKSCGEDGAGGEDGLEEKKLPEVNQTVTSPSPVTNPSSATPTNTAGTPDRLTVIARGVSDRTVAQNLATQKRGKVVSDPDNPNKFMVVLGEAKALSDKDIVDATDRIAKSTQSFVSILDIYKELLRSGKGKG